MEIKLKALVKAVNAKALVSGDKSYRIMLEALATEAEAISGLTQAPADKEVTIFISWE